MIKLLDILNELKIQPEQSSFLHATSHLYLNGGEYWEIEEFKDSIYSQEWSITSSKKDGRTYLYDTFPLEILSYIKKYLDERNMYYILSDDKIFIPISYIKFN